MGSLKISLSVALRPQVINAGKEIARRRRLSFSEYLDALISNDSFSELLKNGMKDESEKQVLQQIFNEQVSASDKQLAISRVQAEGWVSGCRMGKVQADAYNQWFMEQLIEEGKVSLEK